MQVCLANVTLKECTRCESDGVSNKGWHAELEISVKTRTGARCELKRTFSDLQSLDYHLHECSFGRSFSRLANLGEWNSANTLSVLLLKSVLKEYIERLSVLISDRITCCSLFEFLELESHGLRKGSKGELCSEEEEHNVPALSAARCVKAHNATDSDELSLFVGDLVAVVDMPNTDESIWWKGKRGMPDGCFKLGYFPFYCVELFSTHNASTLPTQGDLAPTATATGPLRKADTDRKKSVLLKRGKLSALLRTFLVSRPSRNTLKQRGLLQDRVFGCDLSEYLLRLRRPTPPILELCTQVIESIGVQPGIYRLSGSQSVIHRLRARLDDDDYLASRLAQGDSDRALLQAAKLAAYVQPCASCLFRLLVCFTHFE